MMTRSYAATVRSLDEWLRRSQGRHEARCAALPLRRDVVTVLSYVRDHKVVGTQSTGNFPLKVVREVTARFVKPPVLDTKIGDRVYRLRTEDDVWPLVFVHDLSYSAQLLVLEPGRRWELSPAGAKFLQAHPLIQVWILFATWWDEMDWVVAFPVSGMAEGLPPRFKKATLDRLRGLPSGARIPYPDFADELIQTTNFTWPSADATAHRSILHIAVQRMVVNILAKFEVLEAEFEERPLGEGTTSQLVAFRVTPLGHDLLDSLSA